MAGLLVIILFFFISFSQWSEGMLECIRMYPSPKSDIHKNISTSTNLDIAADW